MNDLYANYPWVPFFQELAKAILKYKDDRRPLLAWLRRDLSDLKSREKKAFWFCEKITDSARNDIDPFSIFAILCKKYNYETLERILPIFKDFFKIQVDASSSDWGLITTNTTHFFFTNDNNDINTLWEIFEKALSDKDFEKEFDIIQEKFAYYYLTYCLSWICPCKYLGLSQNVIAFIRPYFDVNTKINYTAYKQLLKQANRLIEEKTLACNSLVQLTEIAQRGNLADQIWFVPGTPQDLKDGKIILRKNLLRELLTNYGMLSAANPRTDTVVLYDEDTNGNDSSICLYMWGKFLPHKIKMKSDMLSHIEWHSYGDNTINYKKDRHNDIFCENATAELLNLLRINTDNNNKASNMGTNHQKRINEFITLLEANKNLILTGAPGTGKTFMAKEIAKAMNCSDNEIGFVQFHPSYDYTDFVEGLRPVKEDKGSIGFKRANGVFKNFCKDAICKSVHPQKYEIENALIQFKKDVCKTNGITIKGICFNSEEEGEIYYMKNSSCYVIQDKSILEYILDKDNCLYSALTKAVGDYITDNYYVPLERRDTNTKKFVFIIDEINRGEIGKIFGELFFSIDPGYRGECDRNGNNNKVLTQYQNLIEDKDVFKNGFFVPENVYIIGTMNDIDRSVESMDFAIHRRFAFAKVTAEESYKNMIAESKDFTADEKTEIWKRMSDLNKAILKPELRLGEAYQIGAAYFCKYINYRELGMEQAFAMLWNYHLKGLLFEYLRGNQNAKSQLEELKKAYDKQTETDDESDTNN